MVHIAPLLSAIAVFSNLNTGSVDSNDLSVRQTFNPSELPAQCQAPCQVINTLTSCENNLSCFCASSVGSELQQCMSCLVQQVPSVQSEAQQALTSWNQACSGDLSLSGTSSGSGGSSGGTVPAPSATPGSSGGSSSPFSSKSGGAVGLAAYSTAVCIVAALAGAYVTL